MARYGASRATPPGRQPVGKSRPTGSHHLQVLVEAGPVTGERRGRDVWDATVPAALEGLRGALAAR